VEAWPAAVPLNTIPAPHRHTKPVKDRLVFLFDLSTITFSK
jgi:hypothetical protein